MSYAYKKKQTPTPPTHPPPKNKPKSKPKTKQTKQTTTTTTNRFERLTNGGGQTNFTQQVKLRGVTL